jgi:hypothetical protein
MGQRPQQENRGPWRNDLVVRRGADGTIFGAAEVLIPSAGVPSAIRNDSGRLILVFQWFPQERAEAAHFDRVAVVFSEDHGRTWSTPVPIRIDGYPETFQRPFDPTLTVTEEGLYRLYYSAGPKPRRGERPQMNGIATHSAVSADGIHYVYEPGARFAVAGSSVIDPAAILFKGIWHLTCPRERAQDGAYHAISLDGLTFMRVAEIASAEGANTNWLGNFLVVGADLRFYGCGGRGLWWSSSQNGMRWSTPRRTNIFSAGDPTVVQTANGEFLAIYVAESPQANERRTNFAAGTRP